ncbi:MAG TPA: helix-turn-helix domain-containing protein [Thermomicrobiales bacterium]|jgi:DNA-binding transcriptional MerR regulator
MNQGAHPPHPRELSVGDAAASAGVSRQTIYSWIRRGYFAAECVDGCYRIDATEFERLRAIREAAAAAGVRIRTARRWCSAPGDGHRDRTRMVPDTD